MGKSDLASLSRRLNMQYNQLFYQHNTVTEIKYIKSAPLKANYIICRGNMVHNLLQGHIIYLWSYDNMVHYLLHHITCSTIFLAAPYFLLRHISCCSIIKLKKFENHNITICYNHLNDLYYISICRFHKSWLTVRTDTNS